MVYDGLWLDSHCPTRSSSLLRSRKLSYRKVSNSFTSTARSAHSGGGWPSTLKPKNWVWHRAVILGSGLSKNMWHMHNMFFCKMLGLRKFSQQYLWVDLEDVPSEKTQHLMTQLFDFQRFDPVLFPKLAIGLMIKVEKWAWINMTDQDYMDIWWDNYL